ncbi:hypothetical protein [Citricoccus sp. K5]|uniref:hypothetical protein n=1 Tax=Citricoccus sp. K5 TaxID=2653135 RepID=UPI0012F23C14|nr:hypothetical protein [Citricoccus sp. K5]VXA90994.1 conserved membrane hypothetical protein [Citricoccus sp. K5]
MDVEAAAVGALLIAVGAVLIGISVVSYRGSYLKWVLFRPVGAPFGPHWALLPMAVLGSAVIYSGVHVWYTLSLANPESRPPLPERVWLTVVAVAFVATFVLSHWQPDALKPGWYREWENRGRPEAEIREVMRARKAQKKRRRNEKG